MNILVTGLCLQGNKGGPALALSLKKQISNHVGPATFTFSVPPGQEFKYEVPWSVRYGVQVIEDFPLTDILPPYCFRWFRARMQRVSRWLAALRSADVVVEMSAISYAGPPTGPYSWMFGGRFRYFVLSRLLCKRFYAWTQSYGPFSTPLVRWLAKIDLRSQRVVFCRGDDCHACVRELLPDKTALSFPDVAVTLEFDQEFGREYVTSVFRSGQDGSLVTISPSSVLHTKTRTPDAGSRHAEQLASFCEYLTGLGYHVLLVPHTYRPNRPDPCACDLAVSRLVLGKLENPNLVNVVTQDLSPIELKSIISCADIHIGARYHSVVAALSSGVPCISLSWHPKYKDIMRMYGVEEYVYDGVADSSASELRLLFDRLRRNVETIKPTLVRSQGLAAARVEENAKIFCQLMLAERKRSAGHPARRGLAATMMGAEPR